MITKKMKKLPSIALGTWSWGTGFAGGDQVAIAWAIAKNTLPIIGVTKTSQIEDALNATKIILTNQEIKKIEALAGKTGVDTRGACEKSMV